jgi:hypothetical protein
VELLPYQDGRTLLADNSDHGSTEILDNATTTDSGTHLAMRQSRLVFMAGQPPQIPMPNPLDIQDGEETKSNISSDAPLLTERWMNRGQLGKERTRHDKFDATAPATARKSGNGTRHLAVMSNNDV